MFSSFFFSFDGQFDAKENGETDGQTNDRENESCATEITPSCVRCEPSKFRTPRERKKHANAEDLGAGNNLNILFMSNSWILLGRVRTMRALYQSLWHWVCLVARFPTSHVSRLDVVETSEPGINANVSSIMRKRPRKK